MGEFISELSVFREIIAQIEAIAFGHDFLLPPVADDVFFPVSSRVQRRSIHAGKIIFPLFILFGIRGEVRTPAVGHFIFIEDTPVQSILPSACHITLLHRVVAAVSQVYSTMDAIFFRRLCHNIDDAANRTPSIERRLPAADYFHFADIFHRNHIPVHCAVPGGIHLLSVDEDKDILGIIPAEVHAAFHRSIHLHTGRQSNGLCRILHIAVLNFLFCHDLYIRRNILCRFCLPGRRDSEPFQFIHRHRRRTRAYTARGCQYSQHNSILFTFHLFIPFTSADRILRYKIAQQHLIVNS